MHCLSELLARTHLWTEDHETTPRVHLFSAVHRPTDVSDEGKAGQRQRCDI